MVELATDNRAIQVRFLSEAPNLNMLESMKRYWVSWYSGNYEDEGCTTPPFKFWVTGYRSRPDYGLNLSELMEFNAIHNEDEQSDFLEEHSRDNCTICAAIDAEAEQEVWKLVCNHFPDYSERFINEVAPDFVPGDRFR